jgi:hypothetical protein
MLCSPHPPTQPCKSGAWQIAETKSCVNLVSNVQELSWLASCINMKFVKYDLEQLFHVVFNINPVLSPTLAEWLSQLLRMDLHILPHDIPSVDEQISWIIETHGLNQLFCNIKTYDESPILNMLEKGWEQFCTTGVTMVLVPCHRHHLKPLIFLIIIVFFPSQ